MFILWQVSTLLLAAIICVLIKRYFILTSGSKRTNLPFISGYNLLTGSKNIIFTNNKVLAENAHDRHKELGDTFGCYFGQNMQIFSRDPDLVKKICSEDFSKHRNRYYFDSLSPLFKASLLEARDQEWQTSRKAIASVLTPYKLKRDNVEADIDDTISSMLVSIDLRLEKLCDEGEEGVQDVYQLHKNFFMQVLLKIVFHTDHLVDFGVDHNDFVEDLHKFLYVNYEAVARYCFLIPVLTTFVRPFVGFFDHGKYLNLLTVELNKIIRSLIGPKSSPANKLTTIHSMIESYRKGELSKDQLMGNAVFLMVAGFATSVDTMSILMWELAKNQEVQNKLRADLLQCGEKSKYLVQCINETMRLYPGAMTNRELGEDVQYKDFCLVKGACFNVSVYSIHRDPRYWGEDAEIWRPERFEASEVQKHHLAQFIPFGIGPRNCVGYHLARLELVKFAKSFLLQYKVEPCQRTQERLNFVPLGALPAANLIESPVYVKLSRITGS